MDLTRKAIKKSLENTKCKQTHQSLVHKWSRYTDFEGTNTDRNSLQYQAAHLENVLPNFSQQQQMPPSAPIGQSDHSNSSNEQHQSSELSCWNF